MINNPEFGYTPNNLKALRQKHNLTQDQLAQLIDVAGKRTILKWEKGERDMPHTKWQRLLTILTHQPTTAPTGERPSSRLVSDGV